jgi:hypothetical protein
VPLMVVRPCSYQEKEDIISFEKEASGLCLFYWLHGVQVVGCSRFGILDIIMMRL